MMVARLGKRFHDHGTVPELIMHARWIWVGPCSSLGAKQPEGDLNHVQGVCAKYQERESNCLEVV